MKANLLQPVSVFVSDRVAQRRTRSSESYRGERGRWTRRPVLSFGYDHPHVITFYGNDYVIEQDEVPSVWQATHRMPAQPQARQRRVRLYVVVATAPGGTEQRSAPQRYDAAVAELAGWRLQGLKTRLELGPVVDVLE